MDLDVSIGIVSEILVGKDPIETLARLHRDQAVVIQAERHLREEAERELKHRELHHYEVEQENARLESDNAKLEMQLRRVEALNRDLVAQLVDIRLARSNHPECKVHPGEDEIFCGWKSVVQDIDAVLARIPE